MGGKRTGRGNYLYFCIAVLMYLAAFGCAVPEKPKEPPPEILSVVPDARDDLIRAQRLLAQGNYQSSLRVNEEVLAGPAGSRQGDEALFNIGLIFAHHGNPNRDYQKSIASFKKLAREYPNSPLTDQGKIWTEVLEENIRLKRASSEALQENARLKQIIEQSKKVDVEIEEKKREEKR